MIIHKLVVKYGLNLKKITLIGHSLGAHVAGIAGKILRELLGQTVAIVIGLDPAKPRFDLSDHQQHIWRGDGDLVYIIHTGGDGFGIMEPLGDVDVYPNGGKAQPGCSTVVLLQLFRQQGRPIFRSDIFHSRIFTGLL